MFVVLPTGYRKSMIFGCLPVALIPLHKEKPIVLVTVTSTIGFSTMIVDKTVLFALCAAKL